MTTFTGTSGNDILPLTGARQFRRRHPLRPRRQRHALRRRWQRPLVGGTGVDTLYGGAGVDTASYAGAAGTMTVNLTTGLAVGSDAAAGGRAPVRQSRT